MTQGLEPVRPKHGPPTCPFGPQAAIRTMNSPRKLVVAARSVNRRRQTFPSRLLSTLLILSLANVGISGEQEERISFANDVVPVLTKAGCNAGVCHAKAGGGQNGFQLSLLGFEPRDDFETLVSGGRGRRVFPAAPDRSLVLMKASARMPHGGGLRLHPDSEGYRLLRTWISTGMIFGHSSDPKLVSFEVEPKRSSIRINTEQQLKAFAYFSDDSVRDVTHLALYESNDKDMAEVTDDGLVRVLDIPGRLAVMVRYQGQVAAFRASIPLGAPIENLPPAKNFIDEAVFHNLKQLGIPPSSLCDEATYLRRVSLDIAGRLPTVEETQSFLAEDNPDKRDRLVNSLLQTPGYADYFANKWTTLLKNRRDDTSDMLANFGFHSWVRDSLLANKPYDQIVRELLGATGTIISNPPVAWYKRVKEPKEQIEDVAQLFLGVRMQCAQCHHHPFERWSQDDYYGLAAFFSQVGRMSTATRNEDLIFHRRGIAAAKNPRSGVMVKPAALGDVVPDISPDDDPRLRLAEWMSSRDNSFFAKALVNRYWKHFFKRGLIEPEDDIRDTNPPTNPELLSALEKYFIDSGFDLKRLVRTITQSNAYQLSAIPNEHNIGDQQNYSRYYPRRMQAEVLLDAIDQLTGAQTDFANLPPGTRAVALPDNSYNNSSPFLKVFGRPDNSSVCECERVQSSNLAQSLYLLNSADVKSKLAAPNGRAQKLSKDDRSEEEKIRELYLATFSREVRPGELKLALDYLAELRVDAEGKPMDAIRAKRENYEDMLWALICTKEFLFNH